MFSSFFALLKSSAGLFRGFTPPAARQAPVVFFICQIPLRFCTSIWKEPFWKKGNRIFPYWKWCFSWWCGTNGAANATTFVCKTAHFAPQTQRFCIVISHKKRRKQGAKWAFPPVFHVPFWRLFYNRLAISAIPTHTIFGVFPSKIFWNENTPIL